MKDLSSYEMEEIIGGADPLPPSLFPPVMPIPDESTSNDPYEGANGGRRSK